MSWIEMLTIGSVAFPLLGCAAFSAGGARDEGEFAELRAQMVDRQILARGIGGKTAAALREVPRHEFVPENQRLHSYEDRPLPIGHGVTISQPYIVGFMTDQLDLQPGDKVLEIGTGSGYQAAVLAALGAEVYSIEIIEPLAQTARGTLDRTGYGRVRTRTGDGSRGWPEAAPFDRIIVTASPDRVPQPLIDQLGEGGRMILPVGDEAGQQLYLLEKSGGHLHQRAVLPVRFVPMTGEIQDSAPESS